MRKLIFALVLAAAACGPRGYYVANVYSVNGALMQEKCEVSYNTHVNPYACHVEPVAQMPVPPPGYDQPPPAAPSAPPAPPAASAPGY
jgi:hypothetical protein